MEVISRPLAGAVAENAYRSLRLAEDHIVAVHLDVIDAEQHNGLAIVAFVEPLLEFDDARRSIISKTLDVGEFEIEPERRVVGLGELKTAIFGREVRSICGRGRVPVDGHRGFDDKFIDHPETVRRPVHIVFAIQRFAGKQRKCGADANQDSTEKTFHNASLFKGQWNYAANNMPIICMYRKMYVSLRKELNNENDYGYPFQGEHQGLH